MLKVSSDMYSHVLYTNGMTNLMQHFTCNTVIPEIFTFFIFLCLIFAVIYYSQFQEAIIIRCSINSFKSNFSVFNFCGFF